MIEPAASRMPWAIRTEAGPKNCGRNKASPVAKRMALARGRTSERHTAIAAMMAAAASSSSPVAKIVAASGWKRTAWTRPSRPALGPAGPAIACSPKSSAP
jgi:hypothetical protein